MEAAAEALYGDSPAVDPTLLVSSERKVASNRPSPTGVEDAKEAGKRSRRALADIANTPEPPRPPITKPVAKVVPADSEGAKGNEATNKAAEELSNVKRLRRAFEAESS
mmetsp:Transcript_57577/g.125167  ORF Transcript_57577/g.125167 Transcript_57577/m.125167 type:complete len:109 (+) Transcript_57577:53-379(+)